MAAALEEQPEVGGMEIAFYDVETTVPERKGQGFEILEFGAVVVSARGLSELDSFFTLVRPSSLSLVTKNTIACNGISPSSLEDVPSFADIADRVYGLLHGRIWGGHNIKCFDNVRIQEAFARINRPAPQAAGLIDTLPLLRKTFGYRAGNLKMATLASYFGLGKQEHRSLADVRMNIEVLKLSATLLFLEHNFDEILKEGGSNDLQEDEAGEQLSTPARTSTLLEGRTMDTTSPCIDMGTLAVALEEVASATCTEEYLEPDQVSLSLLTVEPLEGQSQFSVMHGTKQLRIRECGSRVKFSVSTRFAFSSSSGKPTFSIVIVPSSKFLALVKHCQDVVKKAMGQDVPWRQVVSTYGKEEAVRVKIGTAGQGAAAKYTTRICNEDGEPLTADAVDLESFQKVAPAGCFVDLNLSCFAYCMPGGYAGLQLLADKLIIKTTS